MPNPRRFAAAALVLVALAAASFDYTVQRGDTLGEIAREHGVSTRSLVEANGLSNPDLIRVGQVLVIPGSNSSSDAGSSGTSSGGMTYTVQRGDSLYKIAAAQGVTLAALIEANDITNANLIRPGQQLVIPGASGSSGGTTSGGDSSSSGSSGTVVASSTTYVVRSGDTLGKIAAKFGVSTTALAEANGITNWNLIFPGQKLSVNGGTSPSSTPTLSDEVFIADGAGIPSVESYTVASGDTLGAIASRFGVGASAIIDANGITNPNVLSIGQHLVIPLGDGWACPLPGSSFVDTWGAPRSGGRLHEGTDVFAPEGTPFFAPVSGVVTTRTGEIAGLQVELLGDDGVWYFATHMSAFGDTGRVNKGDIIGYVGNTGNAYGTPPHAHIEIHPHGRGTPVNPYWTLRKACS